MMEMVGKERARPAFIAPEGMPRHLRGTPLFVYQVKTADERRRTPIPSSAGGPPAPSSIEGSEAEVSLSKGFGFRAVLWDGTADVGEARRDTGIVQSGLCARTIVLLALVPRAVLIFAAVKAD